MNRGPHPNKSFDDISKNMLVNYICRADLEANKKLLKASKMNMEKKEKLKFLEQMKQKIMRGCKQDKVNNLITLSKLEQVDLK
jgi:hypothetical protein